MARTNPFAAILLIIVTIILPPLGVFIISGCGPDLFINILLTLLGYLPGHIHAFYLEWVYYDRRSHGSSAGTPAGGIYSERILRGDRTEYGTVDT